MSTWQIFADDGNTFRWEISGQQLQTEPAEELLGDSIQQSTRPYRLPSMADLLLQGSSRLMENGSDPVDSPPMFKTGLGKSVVLKKSSISKALSILGDEGDLITASGGQLCGRGNQGTLSNSMFQTGSGKAVNISSTGLVRAKTLLGLEGNHNNDKFNGFERTKKQSNASEPFYIRSSSHLSMPEVVTNTGLKDTISAPTSPFNFQSGSLGSELNEVTPNYEHSAPRSSPIKFHTAGGRSISVSSDALQRARSLLGDPEVGAFLNGRDASHPTFSTCKDTKSTNGFSNKENGPNTFLPYQETTTNKQTSKVFISPIRSSSNQKQSSVRSTNIHSGSNLIKKFDAESDDSTNRRYNDIPRPLKPLNNRQHSVNGNSAADGIGSRVNIHGKSSPFPLLDISNTVGVNDTDKQPFGEKRRFGRRSSISPFKRPRSTKFITPLNSNTSSIANGPSTLAPEESHSKRRVSTRYPNQASRTYIKEYCGVPPCHQNNAEHLPNWVRKMNPENAEKHVFHEGPGLDSVGVEAFSHMLSQAGASLQYVSPKWVANHYKWIVWKLACYERCYPAKFSGKMLSMSNAFEELKYRYEREVNHGHRSAIRRILEGDASPSSMLVLCISSIYVKCDPETETLGTSDGADGSTTAKIEVTDGWYSVNALLDVLLSEKLAAGKLFVGQKIRIAGAGLCGWVGPVSPLEASNTISLSLHINGTYRAHWGDRLGFCKEMGTPLAFRCIKGFGGAVPSTLVGVTRIYPILYRERLRDGGFVVRSERLETKMVQLHNQRRSTVAEGIMSEFQMGNKESENDYDSDEGAKILKILETAAEPELLMAEMSSEQLNSFANYRAKLEAMRQNDVHKSIEKALVDAGLSEREVTPFMRVRVVGLATKSDTKKSSRKGLITIWNPTAKQQSELVEGKAYVISGLNPQSSDSDILYLQASGGTIKWRPLSSSAIERFRPFFIPRKPVPLSKMGEVPLSSEFDIAAFVVYVGEVYLASHQKKQWVFVTDGSTSVLNSEEPYNDALLAISFSSPNIDSGDSFVPINYNLEKSTVGFCNLIKKAKDQMNHLWVAEATENSAYFLSYDHAHCTHLKDAAASAQRWAKNSSKTIEKLRGNVLSIIGKC